MPAPQNYNDRGMVIDVDPNMMFQIGSVDLPAAGRIVADSVVRINGIWQALEVGWAGVTADEALDFSNRWNGTMMRLFGTEDDPQSGVLPKISYGLAVASINYASAEDQVIKMFSGYGESGDGDTSDQRNNTVGPVIEHTDRHSTER
jgi:hypothetical protein